METILEVNKLNLVFRLDTYRSWTWRDTFTRATRDPIGWITKQPDRLHIAKDLSFNIRSGERVGLLGVNGTGKTSLCRVIAGMYSPTSGTVKLNGRVRAVFDTAVGINGELTGRENAELLIQFMFPEDPHPDELINDALEFSELGQFIDVPYRLYSNGMQSRLCLSIISVRPSDLLILDEVFEGADAFFREKISRRVVDMIERSGAVIFVSHNAEQVRKVCNRVIVLERGSIAFDGAVEKGLELYSKIRPFSGQVGE